MNNELKFFCVTQYNCGRIITNPTRGIGFYTVVEALSLENAIKRFEKIGLCFDGEGECPHCKTIRWQKTRINSHKAITPEGSNPNGFYEQPGTLFIHTRTGNFFEYHNEHRFSRQTAKEALQLATSGLMKLRVREIEKLHKLEAVTNNNPVLSSLDPLRMPALSQSKYVQHEVLYELQQLGIIKPEVADALKKTDLTPNQLATFQHQIRIGKLINKAIKPKPLNIHHIRHKSNLNLWVRHLGEIEEVQF